jgi:hypothetical protein
MTHRSLPERVTAPSAKGVQVSSTLTRASTESRIGVLNGPENRDGVTAVGVRISHSPPLHDAGILDRHRTLGCLG